MAADREGPLEKRGEFNHVEHVKWLLLSVAILEMSPLALAANRESQTRLFWHHRILGHGGVWYVTGTLFDSAAWITNDLGPLWHFAGVGDFNHDRAPDLIVRNLNTGENSLWLMRDTERTARRALAPVPADLVLVGTGDFNSDDEIDLVWQDVTDGSTSVWFMQGAEWPGETGWLPQLPSLHWRYAAPADFNQDGYVDLVAHNTQSGANLICYMQKTNRIRVVEIAAQPDLSYRLIAAGVFNPLGQADLLWRNTSGSNQVWRMNGAQLLGKIDLRHHSDTNWVIVGTSSYELDMEEEVRAAAVAGSPIEDRGVAILVVDRTFEKALSPELATLRRDLTGDGWRVVSTNTPRHNETMYQANIAPIASIKRFVTHTYHATGGKAKAVLLVGRVPVPYSGFHSPDGHGGRALPFDGYYGDVDGHYTDTSANFAAFIDGAREARHDNRPGDGKWDQMFVATNAQGQAALELAVGRIDFSRLPAFHPQRELDLLRQYLRKDHQYRHKRTLFPDRVIVGNYLPGDRPGMPIYREALHYTRTWFGAAPEYIVEGDLCSSAYRAAWSFHAGFGLPYGVRGLAGYQTAEELAGGTIAPRAAFCSLFGSYFLDWDYTNNFLRSVLATPRGGLGSMWVNLFNRSDLPLRSLALGEPIANGLIESAKGRTGVGGTPTFFSYLGDPTLRLHVIAPPSDLSVQSGSAVTLTWRPSPDSEHYFIYISTNQWDGPWKQLSPGLLPGTQFVHTNPPAGEKLYQVRAVGVTQAGRGSYTNLSQGIFVRLAE